MERGGTGAGTVVLVGRVRYRMTVSEPEPGRVLQEEDRAAGVRTLFTLTPLDGGARTHLDITTYWTPRPGLTGLLERLVNPVVTRTIYR